MADSGLIEASQYTGDSGWYYCRAMDRAGKIYTTLELIRVLLNEVLTTIKGPNPHTDKGDWVALAHFFGPDGTPTPEAENKLVMFLANITHEATISTYNPTPQAGSDHYVVAAPPLYIDLHVMCAANFIDYGVGLDVISQTIGFFQQNPAFDHTTLPGLDPTVNKLALEFTNLDISDLDHLIGLAGIRYLPLVLYKLRMLPFSGDMTAMIPQVRSEGTR